MGSPRSSTTRARQAGEMCCNCTRYLPEPHIGREAYCRQCSPVHRVVCFFQNTPRLVARFTEADYKTPIGHRSWYGTTTDKLRELHDKYTPERMLADKEAFEHALRAGRGAVALYIPWEHYDLLREG